MLRSNFLWGAAAVVSGPYLLGCAHSAPIAPTPSARLASYAGPTTALFDDGIEPEAVGYSLDPSPAPESDTLLRARTQQADCVLRVLVVTVTSKHEDVGVHWRLGLRTLDRLAGERCPAHEFSLEVADGAPGSSILRTFDGRLVGVNLVAFVREFRGAGGEPSFHFHMAPEDKEELKAVRVAAVLGEVR